MHRMIRCAAGAAVLLDVTGLLRTGTCQATPEVLPDGRLRLHEEWQWTNGDRSVGRSIVEEVAQVSGL